MTLRRPWAESPNGRSTWCRNFLADDDSPKIALLIVLTTPVPGRGGHGKMRQSSRSGSPAAGAVAGATTVVVVVCWSGRARTGGDPRPGVRGVKASASSWTSSGPSKPQGLPDPSSLVRHRAGGRTRTDDLPLTRHRLAQPQPERLPATPLTDATPPLTAEPLRTTQFRTTIESHCTGSNSRATNDVSCAAPSSQRSSGVLHVPSARRRCTTNVSEPNSTKSALSSAATILCRFSSNSASRAALVMLPVQTTNNRRGERARGGGRPLEIPVLRHHHTTVAVSELRDPGIRTAITVRKIRCVHRIVSGVIQETREPSR